MKTTTKAYLAIHDLFELSDKLGKLRGYTWDNHCLDHLESKYICDKLRKIVADLDEK